MENSVVSSIEQAKENLYIDKPGVEHVVFSGIVDLTVDRTMIEQHPNTKLVIGITQKNNILPESTLYYRNKEYNISGWYTQIQSTEGDNTFTIRSQAPELAITAWFEAINDEEESFRIVRQESGDYNFWMHWVINNSCNLECGYCIETITGTRSNITNTIDLDLLKKNFSGLDTKLKISFVGGGEPFLVPNLIETCEFLTQNHTVAFVTNLTIPKVTELVGRIDPSKVAYILASFHIEELEKRNLIERYIEHYTILRKAGFPIQAQAVAFPGIIEKCQQYHKQFTEAGLDLVFTPFYGTYNDKEYPLAYSEEELRAFGLDPSQTEVFQSKGRQCNAGFNTAIVHPRGDIISCDKCKRWLGNMYDYFDFEEKIQRCTHETCTCPSFLHDQPLFERALEQTENGTKSYEHYLWREN